MTSKLLVKRLSQHATLPQRGSVGAAGYDLTSSADLNIPSRGKALIPTDLSFIVPIGTYGRIAPRSGLAWKNGLDVGAGVIDADYRGAVGVVMFNHSEVEYQVKRGDRIAQLIIEKIEIPDVVEVESLEQTHSFHYQARKCYDCLVYHHLTSTVMVWIDLLFFRGVGGFGSTGTSSLPVNGGGKRKLNDEEEEKTNVS